MSEIVELVNFDGSMWLDQNSSRSLCRRRSQPPIFSRSLSWRAGERHCDQVLDRVTRQLRAAHQRAAIKTFRWGVTVHRRVGWEREKWGIGNRRAASFGPFVLLAQEVSFGGSAASNGNRSS